MLEKGEREGAHQNALSRDEAAFLNTLPLKEELMTFAVLVNSQ